MSSYESVSGVRDVRKLPIFVPSQIDDYGLTAQEFRVYCHIARRAGLREAWPGIDSISKICLISKPTAIAAIRVLELIKMVMVTRKSGANSIYTLTDRETWLPSTELLKMRDLASSTGKNEVTPNQSKRGNATGKNEVTKGSPLKLLQLRQSNEVSSPSGAEKVKWRAKTIEETKEFCKSIEIPDSDAEWFFHKCEGNGWTNNGEPIKDWKATLRSWKSAGYLPSQKQKISKINPPTPPPPRGNPDRNQMKEGISCKTI